MPPRCCGDPVLPAADSGIFDWAQHPVLRLLDGNARAS
jgi:hypothetical protein